MEGVVVRKRIYLEDLDGFGVVHHARFAVLFDNAVLDYWLDAGWVPDTATHLQVVRELALTADQSARIEQVFQASWPALHAAKLDLDRLENELSALIAEGTASESKVLQQIDRVEASRSAMGRTRSLMLYRMHQILSAEQRVKLKALYEAVEREKAQNKPHD